jgi:hypothetical protein
MKKLVLVVPLQAAPFEMGLLCCPDNDVIEHITFPTEFCVVSNVRATRTGLLDHICYELCSKHYEALFPRMLPHQIFMQLQPNECNPDGITTETRRDSMTFERFQMSGLEYSVMHQFFGHESGVWKVPSPTQPFTAIICDFNEPFRQKRVSLLWNEEWSSIGSTKSSFLFVFIPVNVEHRTTIDTKDCSIFGGSCVKGNRHGRPLSDLLAKAVNESIFSVFELFIILPNGNENCYDIRNTYSESGRFFQVEIIQKWYNFNKAFRGCCSSPFVQCTIDLIFSRMTDWLNSLLILYSIR